MEQETHDLTLLLESFMESNDLREHSKYHIFCILADLGALQLVRQVTPVLSPEQRDVLPWDLLQLAQRGGLPCKAVVGVVIGHDDRCTDFAQFVFWALQSCSGSFQLLLLQVINCGWRDE